MGWLQRKGRRWPKEPATWRQTLAIARDVLPMDATSRVEAIKEQHLALGFRYDTAQIHRALAALTDPARMRRFNKRSGRST